MPRVLHTLLSGLLVLPVLADAAPSLTPLVPPASEIGFRAYGLGLLPLDGRFQRFSGSLNYEPGDHADCQVELTVEVASLAMADAATRDTVLGDGFIDAARYPMLMFRGACTNGGLSGMLTLHGITRPFSLALVWSVGRVVATGFLQRAAWGMTAMPILAGPTVRIEVSVPLAGETHASWQR